MECHEFVKNLFDVCLLIQKNTGSKNLLGCMYVVGIAMQGDTDVWTRTGGHVDKCKYHFI